jgi:prolipoprotein diacylglyceryltransferase
MGGKSIVGGLVGGMISVELVKRYLGEKQSTGDLLAIPIALGIALGRIGCFLTGLEDHTYGLPTRLPWGVDFGDGVRRHPTQIYETVFLLVLIPMLFFIVGRIRAGGLHSGAATPGAQQPAFRFQSGDAFKFFMVSYMIFRLVCDAWKPYVHVALGLGSIQWVCVLTLLYYARDIRRWCATQKGLPIEPSDTTQEAARGAF